MTDWSQDLAKARQRVRVEETADVAGDLRRFRHTRRRRKQRNAGLATAGVGAAIALLIVAVVPGSGPESDGFAEFVELRDGSRMGLESDARASVEQDDDEATRILLEHGRARFEVQPRGERVFEVASGDVRVRVLGTVFDVRRLPNDQTHVSVTRGRVRVEGTAEPQVLTSGESTTVPTFAPRAARVTIPERIEPSDTEPQARERRRRSPRRTRRRVRQTEPADTEHAEAEPEPDADDSRTACEQLGAGSLGTAAELMNAADVCRRAGQRGDAAQHLRAVLRDHSSDRRAALAAYTLGRVLLQSSRFSDAADAFSSVNRYGPSRPLRESALVGQVEAHSRAGHDARARALAEQYLEWYPRGGRRDAVRRMAGLR